MLLDDEDNKSYKSSRDALWIDIMLDDMHKNNVIFVRQNNLYAALSYYPTHCWLFWSTYAH